MSEEQIQDVLAVFREACDLPANQRSAFLDTACGGDSALRTEVEWMLASDDTEVEADLEDDAEAMSSHPVRAALEDLAEQARHEQAEAEPLPKSIGGYRILRLIAQGGMGVVYEAEQENPARRVAIKLSRVGSTTGERAHRFRLEAQLLARLQHPGIGQIIEAGTTPPEEGAQSFIVMEYLEGQSLTAYADEHLHSTREKIELMLSVCEAVGFAHGRGVVHRDLKPDNVIVQADGTPKILDFGVAKVEEAGLFGAATLRTEDGRVLGTMGYMAPEQLGGRTQEQGPAADVYSLGVMIYELLTSRLPHEISAATLTRALAVVTATDAPLLGVIRPDYRGDIEAVVAKALEKDPRHRYANAIELQADLERHLRGDPTLARPAGLLLRARKWTRRNPALATAGVGLFLALSTAIGTLTVKNKEVRSALTENRQLLDASDAKQLRLAADADELWPTRPPQVDALQNWLDVHDRLVHRIPQHRAALLRMRASAGLPTAGPWTFSDSMQQKKHDTLAKLVQDLEALTSDTVLLARMKRRRELAETIREKTVVARRADWDKVNDRILENPRYRNLALEPQVGLIPLGMDPDSGLEEFLHLETHQGDIPDRGAEGTLPPPTANTGLIFVLIPGGSFTLGVPLSPNSDQRLRDGVKVSRFLLSKYEMTQGQWERVVGHNPSRGKPSAVKPVNQVSWDECTKVMRWLDLTLPGDEQWEYAARAGTITRWWTGSDMKSLEGRENIFDLTAARKSPNWPTKSGFKPAPWEDDKKQLRFDAGESDIAPVGSYDKNNFGLYDVAGNVSEWCKDAPGYAMPARRIELPFRIVRGGNVKGATGPARSGARRDAVRQFYVNMLGVRPAMIIKE